MAKSKKTNAKREHRIEMEVVVDAYNEEERAMSWYYYLEEHLAFPFEGRIRKAMAASPLRSDETVSVTGLAHKYLCRVGFFVWVLCIMCDHVGHFCQFVL